MISSLFGLIAKKNSAHFWKGFGRKVSPNTKFTPEANTEKHSFLDFKLELLNGETLTDLYVKSTDRQQLLHYISSQPDHTKSSIVITGLLGLFWQIRGFLPGLTIKIWFELRCEKFFRFTYEVSNTKKDKSKEGVPFDHFKLKSMDEEVRRTFTPKSITSFCSARELNNYWVRATFCFRESTSWSNKYDGKRR